MGANNNLKDELNKEIDLIQACINRMAKNSFMLKGWLIALILAIIALLGEEINLEYIGAIGMVSISVFWYLDAYYLKIEKLYIRKYNWVVRKRITGNRDFLYDLNPHNKGMWLKGYDKPITVRAIMFSITILPFYSIPLILFLIVTLMESDVISKVLSKI